MTNRYLAVYFIGPNLLGTSTFLASHPPHSLAYYCATCGDVWARVQVETEGEANLEPYYDLEHVPCARHHNRGVPDWSSIPGSLLTGRVENRKAFLSPMHWARAIEHLPPEVLRREFDINLKWFDQRQVESES